MKKLIALFAISAVASTSAVAAIAMSGTASVSYDDNGSAPSVTEFDADLAVIGTAGGTSVTIGMDVNGANAAITSADMATTIGPVTVAADMHDEDLANGAGLTDGSQIADDVEPNTGVSISINAPIGDATVAVDDSGVITVSGTWSGIAMSSSSDDVTTIAGSIAGMDVSVTNDDGDTSWSLGTTVSGVALTLGSDKAVSATFGLAGNTMVVSSVPAVAQADEVASFAGATLATYVVGTNEQAAVKSHSTVAISRDLTSGATLAATYSTLDDSLTLKASVAF